MTRDTPSGEQSIADQIPQWFEGGTAEQMRDEAFAQIRTLEGKLDAATWLVAFEFGYHCHEKGMNLQEAVSRARREFATHRGST